jgi:hypothetical protein
MAATEFTQDSTAAEILAGLGGNLRTLSLEEELEAAKARTASILADAGARAERDEQARQTAIAAQAKTAAEREATRLATPIGITTAALGKTLPMCPEFEIVAHVLTELKLASYVFPES